MPNEPAIVERIDFADYKSDMDDLANLARNVIEHARREKDNMFRMLIAAAISQPGDLVIHGGALARVDGYDWEIERHDSDDTVRIRVRPKK
jgi:hypothetical protein